MKGDTRERDKEVLRGLSNKRPFIEITRTKKIETQLARIATALEQLLLQQYGYHTDIPTTDTSGPEPEVMYTDQDEHDIQDIIDDMKEGT